MPVLPSCFPEHVPEDHSLVRREAIPQSYQAVRQIVHQSQFRADGRGWEWQHSIRFWSAWEIALAACSDSTAPRRIPSPPAAGTVNQISHSWPNSCIAGRHSTWTAGIVLPDSDSADKTCPSAGQLPGGRTTVSSLVRSSGPSPQRSPQGIALEAGMQQHLTGALR